MKKPVLMTTAALITTGLMLAGCSDQNKDANAPTAMQSQNENAAPAEDAVTNANPIADTSTANPCAGSSCCAASSCCGASQKGCCGANMTNNENPSAAPNNGLKNTACNPCAGSNSGTQCGGCVPCAPGCGACAPCNPAS